MPSSSLPLPLPTVTSHDHPYYQSSTISLPKHQSSPDPKPRKITIRHRLSQLCKDGRPHDARRLFDALPRPSTLLWNTIIIGFICNNFPNEALSLYALMKASPAGPNCDFYTHSSVLKACADSRRLRTGKAIHCHVLRSQSIPSRIVLNSLLNMYSSCLSLCGDGSLLSVDYSASRCDLVQRVFDAMPKRNVVAWNTMVAWYVKRGRFVQAIKQFRHMLRVGVKPTAVTFTNIFPAISSIMDFRNAHVLYGMLLKFGGEYVDDLFSVSSAICMFSELGFISFARAIFDRCWGRNAEVWNTMISGYLQNDCPDEAVGLYLEAIASEQTILDNVTLLLALNGVSQLQELNLGKQLHAYVIKSCPLNVTLLNAIIVMYSRCGFVEVAFDTFEKMTERDVVSWNTMVSAFVQNGLDDEGLMLVYEMQNQGFVIDSVTVTAILSAASNIRNQEIGKQAHAYILRHGIEVEGINSYLIDVYAKSGLTEKAHSLFERSFGYSRDPATWNAMIAGFTQNGLIEQAFLAFRQMLEHDVTPNPVSLASILPACNPMGCVTLGKQLHAFAVRHSMDQNVFVSTALVDVYSKTGAIAYAENVFSGAFERNSVTCTAMILGYGQHGMGKKAVSLFHSLKASGFKPDAVTFVAVLSACSYAGLVDEGLVLFESMKTNYRIQPTVEHYSCVVDMLGRAGRVEEAYEFVKGLGDEVNVFGIWGSLLGACRVHKAFELGKAIANRLLEMETRNHMTGYHVLLSNVYAEEGNWKNVQSLRNDMREKELTKEPGRSSIEIAGCINYFMSRDEEHQKCDEIYKILEELTMEMTNAGYQPCYSSHTESVESADSL